MCLSPSFSLPTTTLCNSICPYSAPREETTMFGGAHKSLNLEIVLWLLTLPKPEAEEDAIPEWEQNEESNY